MKKCFFFYFLLFSFAWGQEELMTIDSTQASYEDQKIILTGQVILEHFLGQVKAEKMILKIEDKEKKMTPDWLEMEQEVSLKFKGGGILECDQAFFDYKEKLGTFKALANKFVRYSENIAGLDASSPLMLESRWMEVKIEKDALTSKSALNVVKALEDVTITYNEEYEAKGDVASYFRDQNPLSNFSGVLKLEAAGLCQLSYRQTNRIRAPSIEIETASKMIKFDKPSGVLMLSENIPMEFSAEMLLWDDQKHLLALKEKVFINQKGLGNISNNDEILIYLQEKDGKQTLRVIDSTGETKLHYIDPEKQLLHSLVSYGKVLVDHEQLRTVIESPKTEDGEVLPGKQIHFTDHYGEIFADHAVLSYEKIGEHPELKKIVLKGHVKILNRTSLNPSDEGEFLQYALAETVEFLPESKEITFIGSKKNRVLFMDEVNSVHISAPALKMMRDPNTHKDSIKGSGDVRFSFLEKELELIKKRFELNKKEKKNDS